MGEATVIILHPPPDGDGPLTTLLHDARDRLADHQARLFAAAGATPGRRGSQTEGCDLRRAARRDRGLGPGRARAARRGGRAAPPTSRCATTGGRGPGHGTSGADQQSPLLRRPGRRRRGRPAGTATGSSTDNALPRRLAERGVTVAELPGRDRLALDLDTPLDLALLALMPACPRVLRDVATAADLRIPRLAEIRAVAADPAAELLVFGRSSSRTLAWLERGTACRVRFLAEERGLRTAPSTQRPARSTLGRLLDAHGPEALGSIVADLADGAILDTPGADGRSLRPRRGRLAVGGGPVRLGPAAARRGRRPVAAGADRQCRRGSAAPILLGGHTIVGPGLRWILPRRGVPSRP